MYKYRYIVVFSILLLPFGIMAQRPISKNSLSSDTVGINRVVDIVPDSLKPKAFKPDPMKSVWMGAIIPGYGQILNKMYWKLPIVYGGFLGCAYAIAWNSVKYENYKTAYRDILQYQSDSYYKAEVDKDLSSASFIQIIPTGYALDDAAIGSITNWTAILKTKQNTFRRYRDLSLIVTVACYAATLVDAYVDAQLFDFDISPDLTLHLQPALINKSNDFKGTLGVQCSFSFNKVK